MDKIKECDEGCDPESKPVKLHVLLSTDVQEPPSLNLILGLIFMISHKL